MSNEEVCITILITFGTFHIALLIIVLFKWERDTAIKQLESHGIPFCGE